MAKKKAPYKYLPADTELIYNDGCWLPDTGKVLDPGISPIIKSLPSPPPLETIAGYGLAPLDQYWEALRPKVPVRLQEMIDDAETDNEDKISKLDANPEYYKEEIDFILWHQKVIREGWWMFNKGKPTPFTADHIFYLTVWRIEADNPEIRMRDWEVHWAIKHFCDDDIFCLGINRPKERQIGETNIISSSRLRRLITTPYYKTYMQSKDSAHAKLIHELLIYENWRRLPFYLQPIWDGDANSVSEIKLFAPKFPSRKGYRKKALNSILGYRDSGEKSLDGIPQIDFIHNDEIGKCGSDSTVNVYVRWEKQKYCLKQGGNKTGFGINSSTVDEMLMKGGREFKKLCDESHATPPVKQSKDYKPRDENGWTVSGLYNIFIPSNEGFLIEERQSDGTLKRSIDKYGFADLKWTTEYLLRERKAKSKGRTEDYLALLRERPLWWDESFLYNVKECNFDLKILRERLDQLAYMSPRPWKRGNLVWKDGIQYGIVEWVDDDENGRWIISQILPGREANRFTMIGGRKHPDCWLQRVGGADPYKYKHGKGTSTGSDGGLSIFAKRDWNVDGEKKEAADFKTYNWICTYSYRHRHIDQYVDDAIKTVQYFGCKIAEETNFSILNRDFERLGYGAYLHHFYNEDGMLQDGAGQESHTKTKMEYFRILDDFISKHGMRVNHPEVLEDCMALQEDFGPFDRLVSCALSLKAAREDEFHIPKNTIIKVEDKTLEDFYRGIPLQYN